MIFLLDTNVVSQLGAPEGSRRVKEWVLANPADLLFISVLTLAEYDKGIENLAPSDPAKLRWIASRDALEIRFRARVLSVSDDIVRRWGSISGEVKRKTKHSPPVVDTMLAATALHHGLTLVTRNVRDVQHSGVTILNPWVDG